jgi:hypothetical protein
MPPKIKESPDNSSKLDEVLMNLEGKYSNLVFEKVAVESLTYRYVLV